MTLHVFTAQRYTTQQQQVKMGVYSTKSEGELQRFAPLNDSKQFNIIYGFFCVVLVLTMLADI